MQTQESLEVDSASLYKQLDRLDNEILEIQRKISDMSNQLRWKSLKRQDLLDRLNSTTIC